MPEPGISWKILGRSSPGYTLVEVIAASALLATVAAVATSTMHDALHAVSTGLEDARWNTTLLLFERTVRSAIGDLPIAFWAPPPRLLREGNESVIVSTEEHGRAALRFRHRGELLTVATPAGITVFHGIASCSVKVAKSSDGRAGGIRILLVGRRHRQEFVIAWRGQRL